jgi:nitrate reductase gamma subunit
MSRRLDGSSFLHRSHERPGGVAGPGAAVSAGTVGGHIIGPCSPPSVTSAAGISEGAYRWFSALAGGAAGAVTLIGFLGLVYRRVRSDRVRRSTTRMLHAIIAWAFWALFPFSRLVHAWSIPRQYLGRPCIFYRRRYSTAR